MFKIGDFSKLSQVTVKTLRYYDDIGLLKPVRVDPFTGYRYYSAEQLPRINRILALKELDLSLEQVARLLDAGVPTAEMRGMLRLKQAEVRQRVREEHERLTRVEARLKQIEEEQEGEMPGYDVVLKKVEPQKVATVRGVIPAYSEVGRLYGELFGVLGRNGIRPAGPPFAIYHDLEYKESDVDVEAGVPVLGAANGDGRLQVWDAPGGEVASTLHVGGYDTIGHAYTALMAWIEANGLHIAGSNREIYLQGPEPSRGPESYVTEVQVPVSRGE